MRYTLPLLLSLLGTAIASHDVCFMRYYGIGIETRKVFGDVVVRVGDGRDGILMDARTFFEPTDLVYVLKNSKGTVTVNPILDGGFSATFFGYSWGSFAFQKTRAVNANKKIYFGCYDTNHFGYCKDYEKKWQRCLANYGG
ncbi:hypothetical protein BGZ59_005821 [Podila verticillata]|nr:hypothetical protein BGZ59_005821 [Podila verticillata]